MTLEGWACAGAVPSGHVHMTVNGKYLIERRLGGGGMAEVFLARTVGAEGFSRQVAIKRVLPEFSDNPHFAQMFVSEARITSQLQHSNLVSVLDFDRDGDGRLFLVMELVDGTDLAGLLATGPLPLSLVIFLAVEILRGLDYAHELPGPIEGMRGIVHRDISPHNILLSWDGGAKLSDFGIAKPRTAADATASVLIKGKPAFMSPEQARGWPLDGRSDLFSVGVMLFEMLCLRPLFAGNTTEETLLRLFFDPIPLPRDLRPELPEDLSSVVASLLVRARDQRTPTARAAIAALVACADYPRNGREELITTLSQRFPGRAPVRARDVVHASPSDPTLIVGPDVAAAPELAARPARRTVTAPPTAAAELRRVPGHANRRRRWLGGLLAGALVLGAVAGMVAILKPATGEAMSAASASRTRPAVTPMKSGAALPEPKSAPGILGPTPEPTAGVVQPEPKSAGGGSTKSSPSPRAPGVAPARDRAPDAPGQRTERAAPRPGGILEIHL
jgi:serine/threonine protein kinase